MNTNKQWMIYGAYGYNGKLIAEKAKAAGARPLLAGRDADKTRAVAGELGLDWVAFHLDSVPAIAAQLAGVEAVLHCAGPDSTTAEPMLQACIQSKTHYLDITGEVDVFRMVYERYHTAAEDAGVVLLPGTGFDVVPSDCLALKLKEELGDLYSFEVAIDARLVPGASAVKSVIEGVKAGNKIREDNRIKKVPLGYRVKEIPFRDGVKTAVNIPMGDLVTANRSAGAENITVFMVVPAAFRMLAPLLGLSESVMRTGLAQNFLKWLAGEFIDGEPAENRRNKTARFWAQGTNRAGQSKTYELVCPHPIEHTTDVALACMAGLLEKQKLQVGALTPAQFYGSGFIDKQPGVRISST